MLTQARLKEVFDYDPDTGQFRRRSNSNPVGWIHHSGYRHIKIDGGRYQASHLVWLYVHGRLPACQIDHRDTDRANDRLTNLREADRSQNGANKPAYRNNSCGIKGVHRFRSHGKLTDKWRAQIKKSGRVFHLGLFESEAAASVAYRNASARMHGEFARFAPPPTG